MISTLLHSDYANSRSTHPEVFYKKGIPKSFAKSTSKQMCQSLYFNKVEGVSLQVY